MDFQINAFHLFFLTHTLKLYLTTEQQIATNASSLISILREKKDLMTTESQSGGTLVLKPSAKR